MAQGPLSFLIITLDHHSYNRDYVIAKEERLATHFVASSKSKFAGVKGLSIRDIIGEPFILTEYGQGYRRVFDKELVKKSLVLTPVQEIGRTDIITTIVSQSNMISYLPDFVFKPLVEVGALCYLDVCDMDLDIWKQRIYHKNKWISKSLKTVMDYIKAHEFA